MKSKVSTIILSLVVVAGLTLMGVGLLIGGRPGSLQTQDGNFVYETRNKTFTLGNSPSWLPKNTSFGFGPTGLGYAENTPSPPSAPTAPTAPSAPGNTQTAAQTNIPAGQSNIQKVEIDITAGHIIIQPGNEAGVTAQGELQPTTRFEGGTWYVEAIYSNVSNNRNIFNWMGRDATTTYTITLPASLQELDLHLEMGDVTCENISLGEGEFSTDLGSVYLKNVTAQELDVHTDLGRAEITGFSGAYCSLETELGSISFTGNVTHELDATCGMGSIDVRMPRPAHYSWEAEVEMGSINIDNNNVSGFGSSSGSQNEATPHFDLDCEMGSITVAFEN